MKELLIVAFLLVSIQNFAQNSRVHLNAQYSKINDSDLNFAGLGLGYLSGFETGVLWGIFGEYQFASRDVEYENELSFGTYTTTKEETITLLKLGGEIRSNPLIGDNQGVFFGGEGGYLKVADKDRAEDGYYIAPKAGFFYKNMVSNKIFYGEFKYNFLYLDESTSNSSLQGIEIVLGIVF